MSHQDILNLIHENNLTEIEKILKNPNRNIDKQENNDRHIYTYKALCEQNCEMFEYLIKLFDPDVRNSLEGNTLLDKYLQGIKNGEIAPRMEEISLILKYTKNINSTNPTKRYNTAFHKIIDLYLERELDSEGVSFNMIAMFLKYGADPYIINNDKLYSSIDLIIDAQDTYLLYLVLALYDENFNNENSNHENLNNETPNHETPNHETPNHETPNHETPNHETPNHETPNHETPNHEKNKSKLLQRDGNETEIDNFIDAMLLDNIINKKTESITTVKYLLYRLIDKGDIESIKILMLYVDIDVIIEDNDDNILCYALAEDKYEIFDYLAEEYDVNTQFHNGETTLIHMIKHTSIEEKYISHILKYVKDINIVDDEGGSALYHAVDGLHTYLDELYDKINDYNDANKNAYMTIISLLLENGADPTNRGIINTALVIEDNFSAIRNELIDMLLKYIPENKSIYDELAEAIIDKHYDDVELLLPYMIDINEKVRGKTLLQYAQNAKEPNLDIIELLIAHGAHR